MAAATSQACRCDDAPDRPYTPFGIASTTAAQEPAPTPSATHALLTPVLEQAAVLTPPVKTTALGDLTLEAPAGQLIARLLSWTTDKPTPAGALAWLVPATPSAESAPGGLYWFDAAGKPKLASDFPAFIPTMPGCTHEVELRRSGPRTATLDVRARCEGVGLAARVPQRSLRVIAPERPQPLVMGLRLAEPPPDEQLSVQVESADLDTDGHDDVAVRFEMRFGNDATSTAQILWLDRAAGPAREFSEPAKSFADQSSLAVVRAKGKNTSEAVTAEVETTRRLMHYLCRGSGSHGVTDEKSNGIDCGDLLLTRDRLLQADVVAMVTRGLIGEALFRFETASWYGETSEQAQKQARTAVESQLAKRLVVRRELGVRAREAGPSGMFSPLAYGADGSLLIQTLDGIQRWRDDQLEDASEEVDAWPLSSKGPQGQTLLGLTYPCESPRVAIQARAAAGALVDVAAGRWLAPRPGVCLGTGSFWSPELRPIRWNLEGISALVGSAWLGPQGAVAAPSLGGPVSANGQHWVATTPLGLFVQHEAESELWQWQSDAVPPRSCVISQSGTQVACLSSQIVTLFEPTPLE